MTCHFSLLKVTCLGNKLEHKVNFRRNITVNTTFINTKQERDKLELVSITASSFASRTMICS
jgi:hypothetical protein